MAEAQQAYSQRKRIITIVQVVLIVLAFMAFGWAIFKGVGYWQGQQTYAHIQSAYAEEGEEPDFSALVAEYPDTVAWLRVAGLPTINYPVEQADDNEFYLRNDPAGRPSVDGSIFLDYRNSDVLKDMHAIVYGHNMRDGSMFGTLKEYEKESFYRAGNDTFTICTPAGEYEYQIFAVDIVNPSSDVFMVGFTDRAVFGAFVEGLKRNSLYDTGVSVSADDQVVTLSTCSSTNRLVVSGKRVTG